MPMPSRSVPWPGPGPYGRDRHRRSPPRRHGGAPPKRGRPPPYSPGYPLIGVYSRLILSRNLPKQPCLLRTCVSLKVRTPWCLLRHSSKRPFRSNCGVLSAGLRQSVSLCRHEIQPELCPVCRGLSRQRIFAPVRRFASSRLSHMCPRTFASRSHGGNPSKRLAASPQTVPHDPLGRVQSAGWSPFQGTRPHRCREGGHGPEDPPVGGDLNLDSLDWPIEGSPGSHQSGNQISDMLHEIPPAIEDESQVLYRQPDADVEIIQ